MKRRQRSTQEEQEDEHSSPLPPSLPSPQPFESTRTPTTITTPAPFPAATAVMSPSPCPLLIPSTPTFDSFLLLDSFLSSLPPLAPPPEDNAMAQTPSKQTKRRAFHQHHHQPHDHRVNLILRTVDFLFESSFVEATLAVLDHSIPPAITKDNGNNTASVVFTTAAVRLFRAIPSHRSMYLVRGSSSNNNCSNAGGVMEYICQLDCASSNNDVAVQKRRRKRKRRTMHCTCRSFFERCKRNLTTSDNPSKPFAGNNNNSRINFICKHLLAVLLAKHLQLGNGKIEEGNKNECSYYQEVEVTEEEFADIMIKWSVVS